MRILAVMTFLLASAVSVHTGHAQEAPAAATPPAWVVEGVPDTVWILVEATYDQVEEDLAKGFLIDAERHAREAVVDHETDVGRRFALAVVLGRRADIEGGRTKVNVAADFHRELEAILELAPDHPQAHHLMGRLYAGVRRMGRVTRWIATNLLGGGELKRATWEAAEEHLSFAESVEPQISDYHMQLANLYRDTDRPDLALEEVGHVLALPASTPLEVAVRAEAEALQGRLR
jgi:hypothetical protein